MDFDSKMADAEFILNLDDWLSYLFTVTQSKIKS